MTGERRDQADGIPDTVRANVLDGYRKHVNHGLARLANLMSAPVVVRAAGNHLYTSADDRLLDCGGYGIFLLGHSHPELVEAVCAQARTMAVTGPLVFHPSLATAARKLAEACPPGLERVCLTNSGAEAVELALKIARLNGKRHIVSTHGGFHGKSMGALSVTGRPAYQNPFLPLLPDVTFVPYGDAAAARAALARESCLILEPVQGEGGARIPPSGYLAEVAAACRSASALLVIDEIQTGLGRTGELWAASAEDVIPDILLCGKALGGGLMPVGAVVTRPSVFAPLDRDPMLHTSTFGGNPLAATAVSKTIDVMLRDNVPGRARVLGDRLLRLLRGNIGTTCGHLVADIRGKGLLLGVEFVSESIAGEFVLEMLEEKVVVSASANALRTIRLTPSAFLSEADIQHLEQALHATARNLTKLHPVSSDWQPLVSTSTSN